MDPIKNRLFDRVSVYKTGSRYFQGVVPNMFMRNLTIARRMSGVSKLFRVLYVLVILLHRVALKILPQNEVFSESIAHCLIYF